MRFGLGLGRALGPKLAMIGQLTAQIRAMDREIERLCREKYPETGVLTQIRGVGSITALAFVLFLYVRLHSWWWHWMPKYLFFLLLGFFTPFFCAWLWVFTPFMCSSGGDVQHPLGEAETRDHV